MHACRVSASIRTDLLLGIAALTLTLSMAPGIRAAAPDFEREVAPILERRCLSCHSESAAKGDLVLETLTTVLAHDGAIVAGKSDASLLIEKVSGPDPQMPKQGAPLTAAEVDVLRRWIDAGAQWPEGRVLVDNPERDLDWWSLQPLDPDPHDAAAGHPVDSFIDAQLATRRLIPAPPAEPLVLIRRLSFDLTGLPPSQEEIDAFLAACQDDPERAWSDLVDRLLASPAFGEKFARHWLDIARYAETHGYDKDKPRVNAWPYRDYVIRSFNEDKPYTRFVQEQVAGDALFAGDPDGGLGLGFLAAGPWDFISHWEVGEGKLDGRIAKHLDRDEMVSAVFNVFQSSTVQCAQCHHHKFDPIRMEDYYRLHAVFAAIDRADRVYDGLPPEQEQRKQQLLTKVNTLKAEQDQLDAGVKRRLAARVSGIDRRIAELKEEHGSGVKPQYGYHSQLTRRQDEEKWVQIDLGRPRAATQVRIIPAYDEYNGIGAAFGFPLRYRVEVSNHPEFAEEVRVLRDATAEDQPSPGTRTVLVDGDGRAFRYLRVTATRLRERSDDYMLALGEVEIVSEGGAENFAAGATVTALDSIERGPRWAKANLVDGIFFRELREGGEAALVELRDLQDQRAAIKRELRPPEIATRLETLKAEIAKIDAELKNLPEGRMVYAAATHFPRGGRFTATGGTPRPIHLLHRGDLRSPGDAMHPGAPPLWPGAREAERFSTESDAEGQARAELARYLTRDDNPLLWRSMANRLWQWTLGAPLVATPNDFGRGGQAPTHPELLDFLAARLRDDPQHSMKAVVRLLVTSEAYRRSSSHHPENAAGDAGNTGYWRAHRRRLSAEEIRDSMLAVSGVLDRQMGGPSYRDFVLEKPQHSPHYEYHLHDPDDPATHRRSIYRFVVRSQPQPMLTTFDCADPSMSVAMRDESTTALQALTQWNQRFVESMAGHFAARLQREAPDSRKARIDLACRLALGRPPDAVERAALLEHADRHGDASLARVVFNLNAFVYVD